MGAHTGTNRKGTPMLNIDLRTYVVLLLTAMLLAIPEIAHSRDLDAELGRMAMGGIVSVSTISIMSGLLRTVQRINNPAAERVRQWWVEAALNALGGFLAGWLSYLTLAHTLPAPAVVLTVAACAYTPVLLVEKFNEFMRSKN